MTRYARAKGSKACNSKQENTPTSWHLLKVQSFSRYCRVKYGESKRKEGSKRRQSVASVTSNNDLVEWFEFCADGKNILSDKVGKLGSGISSYPGSDTSHKIVIHSRESSGPRVPFQEEIVSRGRKTKAVTRKGIFGTAASCDEKSSQKIEESRNLQLATAKSSTRSKFKGDISKEKLKDLRRTEKARKREKKKVCFCCRRWGHQLADCPEFKVIGSSDVSPPAGGLCYHCGSPEHDVYQCSRAGTNSLKFVRCFVCGKYGHLARHCPDNVKGIYPKGGSCRFCGETSHLCSDCPKGVNRKADPDSTLSCANEGPVDGLPEDMGNHSQQNICHKKIIHF